MWRKISWVAVFAFAFAFVESAVVVYLRSLYYPEGFSLPLKTISSNHLWVELSRELATILMLAVVGVLAGATRWQKFAYFMIVFGVWDIFYYVWLKVMLNWPDSVLDWDILFLIPVPWIGPVIAPLLISILLFIGGILIVLCDKPETPFRPTGISWIFALSATGVVLFSFMSDTESTIKFQMPEPYAYEFLVLGLMLYLASMYFTFKSSRLDRG